MYLELCIDNTKVAKYSECISIDNTFSQSIVYLYCNTISKVFYPSHTAVQTLMFFGAVLLSNAS